MPARLTVSALCVIAVLSALVLAGCGGDDSTPTETQPTTTSETAEGDAANGATVWESAGCGSCHTLAAAGSTGSVGPDLDELQPDLDTVVSQVTNGGGGMPAFADSLSPQEILDVSAYVVASTSG